MAALSIRRSLYDRAGSDVEILISCRSIGMVIGRRVGDGTSAPDLWMPRRTRGSSVAADVGSGRPSSMCRFLTDATYTATVPGRLWTSQRRRVKVRPGMTTAEAKESFPKKEASLPWDT